MQTKAYKSIITVLLIGMALILTACPEEVGAPLDTEVFLTNRSDQTVRLFSLRVSASSEKDTLIKESDINLVYSTIGNPPIVVTSGNTISLFITSKARLISGNPVGSMIFLYNIDTLRSLDKQTVQRTHRGVTKYYLRTLQDYEAINYTLAHPK